MELNISTGLDSADRQQMEGLHTLNNEFSDQEKTTLWAPSPGTGPKYPRGTDLTAVGVP